MTPARDTVELGTFAVVYYRDGSAGNCRATDFDQVEAALAKLVGEGEHVFNDVDRDSRDTVLRLTATSGDRLVMLASAIMGVSMSTPDGRRRRALSDLAFEAETPAVRAEGREATQPTASRTP